MYPDAQGFIGYTTRFVDPSIGFALGEPTPPFPPLRLCSRVLGFASGYNYWYSYAVTIPTELVACALVIQCGSPLSFAREAARASSLTLASLVQIGTAPSTRLLGSLPSSSRSSSSTLWASLSTERPSSCSSPSFPALRSSLTRSFGLLQFLRHQDHRDRRPHHRRYRDRLWRRTRWNWLHRLPVRSPDTGCTRDASRSLTLRLFADTG